METMQHTIVHGPSHTLKQKDDTDLRPTHGRQDAMVIVTNCVWPVNM